LMPSDLVANDQFGMAVNSFASNLVLVGAPGKNSDQGRLFV